MSDFGDYYGIYNGSSYYNSYYGNQVKDSEHVTI